MAKIVSEAGEITLQIKSIEREGDTLVLVATMGIWESKVYLSPEEMARVIPMALSIPAVLLFMVTFPIILIKRRFRRRKPA